MMDLKGIIIFEGKQYYRVSTWQGDYLIPWLHNTPPTKEGIDVAITAYLMSGDMNVLGVKRFK